MLGIKRTEMHRIAGLIMMGDRRPILGCGTANFGMYAVYRVDRHGNIDP